MLGTCHLLWFSSNKSDEELSSQQAVLCVCVCVKCMFSDRVSHWPATSPVDEGGWPARSACPYCCSTRNTSTHHHHGCSHDFTLNAGFEGGAQVCDCTASLHLGSSLPPLPSFSSLLCQANLGLNKHTCSPPLRPTPSCRCGAAPKAKCMWAVAFFGFSLQ